MNKNTVGFFGTLFLALIVFLISFTLPVKQMSSLWFLSAALIFFAIEFFKGGNDDDGYGY